MYILYIVCMFCIYFSKNVFGTELPASGQCSSGKSETLFMFTMSCVDPVQMSPPKKLYTLVLLRKNAHILLGLKKRGFGLGKWNGFGGKVEPGETIVEGAKRELKEECDLSANELQKIGILTFEFVGDPVFMEVHVFTAESFHGQPKESEEMKPKWYPVSSIPFHKMWADDKYWFPLFLRGARFQGYFKYSDHETIVEHELTEVTDTVP